MAAHRFGTHGRNRGRRSRQGSGPRSCTSRRNAGSAPGSGREGHSRRFDDQDLACLVPEPVVRADVPGGRRSGSAVPDRRMTRDRRVLGNRSRSASSADRLWAPMDRRQGSGRRRPVGRAQTRQKQCDDDDREAHDKAT
jgi:hypothetical protein